MEVMRACASASLWYHAVGLLAQLREFGLRINNVAPLVHARGERHLFRCVDVFLGAHLALLLARLAWGEQTGILKRMG